MVQRPNAVDLFLCEQVIVEEGTRNLTLVNCFTLRMVKQFPSEKLPFVVFFLLTDGAGEVLVEVAIQRLDTLDEIYRYARTFRFTNPLEEARGILRIRNCSFPAPGSYQIMLFAEGELIGQRKVRVLREGVSS
jgi:hypothetical protein